MPLIAELITTTTDACTRALRPYTDRDWKTVMAAELAWSCWDTALHLADDLYFYAVQLIYKPLADHVPTELALDDTATEARLLDMISVHGNLLWRTIRAADPNDRAHHIYGTSDPEGFAAMGLAETLVHTYDLARGLNPDSSWSPPAAPSAAVVRRLFPNAPDGDPSAVLLYCCGRAPLGWRPRLTAWRWDGAVR